MSIRLPAACLIFTLALNADPRAAVRELLVDPQVQAALAFAQTNEPRVLEYQIQLTEIPAPPFQEQARGRAYAQMFRERGLTGVRTDDFSLPRRSALPDMKRKAPLATDPVIELAFWRGS